MQTNTTRFSRLVDLAKETSSDKRRELLREVTDAFLATASDCNETEKSYFGEILGSVSSNMDVAVRSLLAQQFAGQDHAPLGLIQKLANDDISVAKFVLQTSNVLREQDLIEIAQSRQQDRLSLIASRANVPESVSDAIVENGDDAVVCKLVSNQSAKVSRGTFLKVVERSETSEILQAPLADRSDLPPDMLNDMFSFVSGDLRKKIQQKLANIPPEALEKALEEAKRDVLTDMGKMREDDRKAMVFVGEMIQQKKLNEALLVQLTRKGKTAELTHAFARIAKIDVKTVRRLFNSGNVEGVAIICRSMRFERGTFSTMAMGLLQNDGNRASSINEVLDLYEQVTSEAAQRVMRFWRIRKEVVTASPKP